MDTTQNKSLDPTTKVLVVISSMIFLAIVSGLIYICTRQEKAPPQEDTNSKHVAELQIKVGEKLSEKLESIGKKARR